MGTNDNEGNEDEDHVLKQRHEAETKLVVSKKRSKRRNESKKIVVGTKNTN